MAAVAAWAAWFLLGPVGGVDLSAHSGSGTREVGGLAVVLTSLLAGAAALALLALLERRTARPARAWTIIGGISLTVSLLGPAAAVSVAAGMGLASLHLIVGGVLLVGLRRTLS